MKSGLSNYIYGGYLIETIESYEIISSQHSRNNKHRYNFIYSCIFYTRECKSCFSGFSPFPTLFLIFSILSWSCKNSIESSFVAFLLPSTIIEVSNSSGCTLSKIFATQAAQF